MARYKVFGKAENDQGQLFAPDLKEPNVKLRIRRIPHEMQMRFEKRYGREEMQPNPQTGFKAPQWVHTNDDMLAVMKEKAEWAWTDCVGLTVEIGDKEGAETWGKMLSRSVEIGEVVALDGILTNSIKRALFNLDIELVSFILTKSNDLQKAHGEREERLEGN